MAYIIAEPCIGTKDTACVEVCPVDCIHPTKEEADFESADQLYIDPETCIDCGLVSRCARSPRSFPRKSFRTSGRTSPPRTLLISASKASPT